ncbi:uncharacterized protein LAJ45_11548 [Morchella importuna]|uniref:uncharacterized protein n=1 Tax=Morchella importuna TaxID=1174673 RepID=UPI001E8EB52B|nr:uncharacterized protein LAJ45_11548 [Morchella importuna]KAH8144483.1 hypothetical protein LAJ45_11548 [Morchella importuna]
MATLEEKRAALRAKYDAKIREEMRMLEAQHKDSQPTQIPKSNGIPKENDRVELSASSSSTSQETSQTNGRKRASFSESDTSRLSKRAQRDDSLRVNRNLSIATSRTSERSHREDEEDEEDEYGREEMENSQPPSNPRIRKSTTSQRTTNYKTSKSIAILPPNAPGRAIAPIDVRPPPTSINTSQQAALDNDDDDLPEYVTDVNSPNFRNDLNCRMGVLSDSKLQTERAKRERRAWVLDECIKRGHASTAKVQVLRL